MRRLAALALLAILSLTWSAQTFARQTSTTDRERQGRRAVKQQQKMLKKDLEKQRKATRKYQKQQQKATQRANAELRKRRAQ